MLYARGITRTEMEVCHKMSKSKVEQRKYEKHNRKKIEAAKKRKKFFSIAGVVAVIAAVCVFVGYRIYEDYFKFDRIAVIDTSKLSEAINKVSTAGYTEPEEETTEDEQSTEETGKTEETDKSGETEKTGETEETGKSGETEETKGEEKENSGSENSGDAEVKSEATQAPQ